MAYISSTLKATLEARKARYETMLEAAYDAVDTLSSQALTVERFNFDSGEGSQAATNRELEQLQKQILFYEAQIAHIDQRLNGLGIVNLTMHRRY